MEKKRILIADDDQMVLLTLRDCLSEKNYQVKSATTLFRAKQLIQELHFDLLIFDRLFANRDALPLIKKIRKADSRIRILVLSKLSRATEKIAALQIVDDYLSKPFHSKELQLRVKNLLQREKVLDTPSYKLGQNLNYEYGQLLLSDVDSHRFLPAYLCRRESAIFACLLAYRGKVVSYQQIKNYVWGYREMQPSDKTVSVYIRRIRTKMGDQAWRLKTLRGMGYCLV